MKVFLLQHTCNIIIIITIFLFTAI